MLTTNLETLKIHKLTKAQYERELAAGNVDANALYLTPEEDVDLSQYATKTEISEAQAALQLALDGKAPSSHSHSISDITNLQTSLDAKQATITGGATTVASSNLTASRALISNSSGKIAVSDVTSTELGYLDGVTSAIQTQLNGKQAKLTNTNITGKSKSTASGTVTTITSTSLTAGTYLVMGNATIPSSNSSTADGRKICISTSTSFNNSYAAGGLGASSFATSLNCWALLTLTATTTVYLLGYHGSGSTQTITDGRLTAIKLA